MSDSLVRSPFEVDETRAPIYGIFSMLAPFVGIALAFLSNWLLVPPDAGPEYLGYVGFPIFASIIGGMALAGAAAIRDEKFKALYWTGFLLNGGPFLFVLVKS